MGFLFTLFPGLAPFRLLIEIGLALALAAVVGGFIHHLRESDREEGRAEIRAQWNQAKLVQARVDLDAQVSNARETQRRLEAQQENQRVQNEELAAARRDADRNTRAADELREQNASTAQQWRDALGNSPSVEDREAAGTAIVLLTDMLGRSDRRAGDLAGFAQASRAAGLKCERDYDALTAPRADHLEAR